MKHLFWSMALIALPSIGYAQSESHNLINTTRSSWNNHIFVSQSVEGEYGTMREEGESTSASTAGSVSTSSGASEGKWQGYNTTSTLGLEVFKFIQFNVSHSSVNMRSTKTSLEHLTGSRFSGGARLVFLAPVANLEAGGGVIGTRYDYQKNLDTAGYYGSGVYYSLGMNYFISERVSFFGVGKIISEHSVKSGGDAQASTLTANTTSLGIGFSLWL